MNDFIQFVTNHPVAHVESAYKAWVEQQRHIDSLHAQILEMQHRMEHLEQRAYEAESRLPRLRLINSAA